MKSRQRGFTLIELVVVIVILGILAVSAIPKFIDLTDDAYKATADGIGGALNTANAINYAGCAASGGAAVANKCVKVAKCSDLGALLVPPLAVGAAADIIVGALPATTTAKKIYLTTDTPSTGTGVSCAAVYGNGKAGGVPFTFTAITT